VFLHTTRSAGHIVHSSASEVQNINVLFFMAGWARCGFHKKRVGAQYAKLVFLTPMGSAGQLVLSQSSGAQNNDALFFMLRWARCSFHKKCVVTHNAKLVFFASGGICRPRSAFQCVRAVKRQPTIFHAWVGLVQIPQKLCRDTLR
jgi:hypothetical protein